MHTLNPPPDKAGFLSKSIKIILIGILLVLFIRAILPLIVMISIITSIKTTQTYTPKPLEAGVIQPSYEKLKNDTESFVGKIVSYEGNIFYVKEKYGAYQMLVNVTSPRSGVSTNPLLVLCSCITPIMIGDEISFTGTVDGRGSYQNSIGETFTAPQIVILKYSTR